MQGAQCARSLACSFENKAYERRHHGHTGNTRPSLRNGFNGFLRALPGVPSLATVVVARKCPGRLDTCYWVPGPHDFPVRTGADHRLAPRTVHRIRPAFVTIARAPLCGTERQGI